MSVCDRLYDEVEEITEVLIRESGKSMAEVWENALSLHRVRYDTEVLPVSEGSQSRK